MPWCFIDDNPFERDLVRPRTADGRGAGGVGRSRRAIRARWPTPGISRGCAVTEEDRARTAQYQGNKARDGAEGSRHRPAVLPARAWRCGCCGGASTGSGLQRIVQLINKTNQFNLTTRRYTEDEVLAVIGDPGRRSALQLRLLDRFGDNGIIAIVHRPAATDNGDLLIDTWLMSCRVLGRQVEPTTLNLIAAAGPRTRRDAAGRRVHSDQEERHGEGPLRQAGLHRRGEPPPTGAPGACSTWRLHAGRNIHRRDGGLTRMPEAPKSIPR